MLAPVIARVTIQIGSTEENRISVSNEVLKAFIKII